METKKEKLPKIDENMHHRARVVARKREVFKVQNDVENESLMQCVCEQTKGLIIILKTYATGLTTDIWGNGVKQDRNGKHT